MPACLADCQNEIVEAIVVRLELSDICNLRLADRQLATKTTQVHFKSFFRTKQVLMTRISLQQLVNATKPGLLGSLLRELTITGVVNNTKRLQATVQNPARHGEDACVEAQRHLDVLTQRREDYENLHRSGEDVALLSEAFSNLTPDAQIAKHFSVSLGMVVYRTDSEQQLLPSARGGWKLIWQSTADTFHTVLRALTMSRLPVGALNVFQHEERCSIACNELGRNTTVDRGLTSLTSLESLALSFSDKIIEMTKQDTCNTGDSADEIDWEAEKDERIQTAVQADAEDEGNFAGLANLLGNCSALKDLELHHYHLRMPSGVRPHRERFLQRIVETASLPHLRNLTLRGLIIRGQDMLALLQNRPLRIVSLENITVAPGSFRSIFDHCTDETTGIERLHFDDLFEHGRIQFDEPGKLKHQGSAVPRSSTLNRSGAEVRLPISYHVPQDRVPASPALYKWRAQIRKVYGPP